MVYDGIRNMKTDTRLNEVWSTRPKRKYKLMLSKMQRKGKRGERSKSSILDEALELLYERGNHGDRKR